MQQAIERVTKTIQEYRSGSLSRSLASIELVSAFKVVCRASEEDAAVLQSSVASYSEAVLHGLDTGELTTEGAIGELARVYEAAFNKDPDIMQYIGSYE